MGVLRRFSREEEGDKINLKINGDFFIHFFYSTLLCFVIITLYYYN